MWPLHDRAQNSDVTGNFQTHFSVTYDHDGRTNLPMGKPVIVYKNAPGLNQLLN